MSISKTAENGAPAGALFTSRLVLRPARPGDEAGFWPILSDPVAMRYWSTPPHDDITLTRDWVQRMIDSPHPGTDFVIERSGQLIGKAGMYRAPEVGFILHPANAGQGYATEAMQAIIAHLWATTDVPALTADVDPGNTGSLRVLAKLGFAETGRAERTFCLGGVWADSIYLSLSRPQAGRKSDHLSGDSGPA